MKRLAVQLIRRSIWFTLWLVTIFFTILLVRAFDARRGPALKPWHTVHLREEFSNWDATHCTTLTDYLALEQRLYAEMDHALSAELEEEDRLPIHRYAAPAPGPAHWNRTQELVPTSLRGGVLMLHGLTDAPYSMKHLAELYQRHGYYVLALRLPGHGTLPSGLLYADWNDWVAATELGARQVKAKLAPGQPFHLVGYSNGGALALKYLLNEAEEHHARGAERAVLISPMIGVSRAAALSRFISLIGALPVFEKSRWLDLMTEYQPYKYNSFTAQAGYQSHLLSTRIRKQVARLARDGQLTNLPPILTFQSAVDATVSTRAVVDGLYDHLRCPTNELVIFDVNKTATSRAFLKPDGLQVVDTLFRDHDRPYRLSLVQNRSRTNSEVAEYSAAPEDPTPVARNLELAWPADVYSLSHMALPMPVDDPIYGLHGATGGLSPRGEKGVLTVPIAQFMRLTSNPFYPYLEQKIETWVADDF